jgi:hypothetical protein
VSDQGKFDINITLSDAALGSAAFPTEASLQPSVGTGESDEFDLDCKYLDSSGTQPGQAWTLADDPGNEVMAVGSNFFGITCSQTCAIVVGGGNTCAVTCPQTCQVIATCSQTCAVVVGGGNTCAATCPQGCNVTNTCGGNTCLTCGCPATEAGKTCGATCGLTCNRMNTCPNTNCCGTGIGSCNC